MKHIKAGGIALAFILALTIVIKNKSKPVAKKKHGRYEITYQVEIQKVVEEPTAKNNAEVSAKQTISVQNSDPVVTPTQEDLQFLEELNEIEQKFAADTSEELNREASQFYSTDQINQMWAEVGEITASNPQLALEKLLTFNNNIMVSQSADKWIPEHKRFLATISHLEEQIPKPSETMESTIFDDALGMIWE